MEITQIIRTSRSQSNGIRQFKSGMVGIIRGQVARLNVVNTAMPGSQSTARMGIWQNPRSELLAQETFSLEPGASAFLDLDWDAVGSGNESRHQVRAMVTVLDDADSACVVTVEVFEKDTGKTTVFMEVPDGTESNR